MRLIIISVFLFALGFPAPAISDSEGVSINSVRVSNLIGRSKAKKKKGKPAARDLSSVCAGGIKKIRSGVLYKPAADSTDSRRGKPVVLLQGSNKFRTNSLNVYDSAGNTICKLAFKAPVVPGTNGNSDHYWSGWRGGCGRTGKQLANLARPSGSSGIYIQAKNRQCFGPVNPTSRVGRIN